MTAVAVSPGLMDDWHAGAIMARHRAFAMNTTGLRITKDCDWYDCSWSNRAARRDPTYPPHMVSEMGWISSPQYQVQGKKLHLGHLPQFSCELEENVSGFPNTPIEDCVFLKISFHATYVGWEQFAVRCILFVLKQERNAVEDCLAMSSSQSFVCNSWKRFFEFCRFCHCTPVESCSAMVLIVCVSVQFSKYVQVHLCAYFFEPEQLFFCMSLCCLVFPDVSFSIRDRDVWLSHKKRWEQIYFSFVELEIWINMYWFDISVLFPHLSKPPLLFQVDRFFSFQNAMLRKRNLNAWSSRRIIPHKGQTEWVKGEGQANGITRLLLNLLHLIGAGNKQGIAFDRNVEKVANDDFWWDKFGHLALCSDTILNLNNPWKKKDILATIDLELRLNLLSVNSVNNSSNCVKYWLVIHEIPQWYMTGRKENADGRSQRYNAQQSVWNNAECMGMKALWWNDMHICHCLSEQHFQKQVCCFFHFRSLHGHCKMQSVPFILETRDGFNVTQKQHNYLIFFWEQLEKMSKLQWNFLCNNCMPAWQIFVML